MTKLIPSGGNSPSLAVPINFGIFVFFFQICFGVFVLFYIYKYIVAFTFIHTMRNIRETQCVNENQKKNNKR